MIPGTGRIFIGTSGWNYPRGKGTWNGIFYPPTRGRRPDFDELSYYAERFSTVEVNSTFYGQPRADVTRAWADRTPVGFEFSLKLYQKFTHPRMFRQRVDETIRRSLSVHPHPASRAPHPASRISRPDVTDEDVVSALAEPTPADLDEFRRGVEPLAAAGKLGALLAQFPPSFKFGPREVDYLAELLRSLAGYAVAVELRHKSWSDRQRDTLSLLNSCQAAWTQIDEPKFRFSIEQNQLPNITGFYYMRLHGRNAAAWWRPEAPEDRYNYLYSSSELAQFAETAGAARSIVKKLYLYTNNHYSAKSVANAAMLEHLIEGRIEGEFPVELLRRYPELEGIARVATPARTLV